MKLPRRVLGAIAVAGAALLPIAVQGSRYYCGILVLIGIYVILAVSLDLLVGYTGLISVGHAAFFAIGAYTSGIATTRYALSPLPALALGAFSSGALAWLIGRPVLGLREYYLAMATLAFNEVVVTLITGLDTFTGGGTGLRDIPPFSALGLTLADPARLYYLVLAIAILTIAASFAVTRSPFGKALVAIHSDEDAARHFGVNAARAKTHLFVLSGILASVAGSLFAHHMGYIAPDDFGVLASVNLLVMLYLGGVGTIIGPALGAVFMKLLPELTMSFSEYQLLLDGAILVLVLVFLPRGLASAVGRWRTTAAGGTSP